MPTDNVKGKSRCRVGATVGYGSKKRGAAFVQFAAVLLSLGAVIHEFWIQRQENRWLRDTELHARLAELGTRPQVEDVELAVQKILKLMNDQNVDITGVSVRKAISPYGSV